MKASDVSMIKIRIRRHDIPADLAGTFLASTKQHIEGSSASVFLTCRAEGQHHALKGILREPLLNTGTQNRDAVQGIESATGDDENRSHPFVIGTAEESDSV